MNISPMGKDAQARIWESNRSLACAAGSGGLRGSLIPMCSALLAFMHPLDVD
jgi:hypothetical protein